MVRQSVTTSQSSYHKSSNKVPSVAPVPVHEALAGEPLRHLGVDLPDLLAAVVAGHDLGHGLPPPLGGLARHGLGQDAPGEVAVGVLEEGQPQVLEVVGAEALLAEAALQLLLARGAQRALLRRALVREDVQVALRHLRWKHPIQGSS